MPEPTPRRRRVAVVGASGFIGRPLCRALAARGWQVIAVARSASTTLAGEPVRSVDLDVHDCPPDPMRVMGRPDVLVHLAWPGLPHFADAFHLDENLPAALHFLGACMDAGLGQLLVTGTCLEYGMREGECRESHAADPQLAYARAKHALQQALTARAARLPCVLQWARLFYMHGAGQNPRSLLAQLDAAIDRGDSVFAMSHGEQGRDYLPVDTVAAYLADIAAQSRVDGIINCCSGHATRVVDLVRARLRERGCSLRLDRGRYPVPDYEPHTFWGSTGRLEQALGRGR